MEKGRSTLTNHQVAVRLAEQLRVTVGWLYGQPYEPLRPDQDAGQTSVPALRTALRRIALTTVGQSPPLTAPPESVASLRARLRLAARHRQAAALAELAALLPALLEDLNTAVLTLTGPSRDEIRRMIVEACHIARVMLNLLGFHDLAWTATDCAGRVAEELGDPLILAESAWNRCGVLLHSGTLSEALTVATGALGALESTLRSQTPEVVSLCGALHLRCAVVSARRGRRADAESYVTEARQISRWLPAKYTDLRFHTVFSRNVTEMHAVEVAVELGDVGSAVTQAAGVSLAAIPSGERRVHHRVTLARAYGGQGKDALAVEQLRAAAIRAPHYVHNQPMARQLVSGLLLRDQPTARGVGLAELARGMGLD